MRTEGEKRDEAARQAARAAAEVPGVAFLSPGLGGLIRSAAQRLGTAGTDRAARPHGVRVRRGGGAERWQIEVQLAVRQGHRALDVARAVRSAVQRAVPSSAPVAVKVTVTHLV